MNKRKIIWKFEGYSENELIMESYPQGFGHLKGLLDLLSGNNQSKHDRKIEKFEVKDLNED